MFRIPTKAGWTSAVACRGELPVDCWRGAAGFRYPIHSDCDPADQQAIAEPHAGQRISPNRAAARPLGQIAFREKCAQWIGAAAVLVLGDLRETTLISVGRRPSTGQMHPVAKKDCPAKWKAAAWQQQP
jgi:hypothetical protein